MKVLWFSNNAAAGNPSKSKGTGSWLAPLDVALQEQVELSVAFHYPYKKEPYKVGKTNYYSIYTGNIIVGKIKDKFLHTANDEEYLDQYLDIVKKVQPDIIHIHGTELPYAAICGKVNVPVVVSIQGNISVYYLKFKSGLGDKYINTRKISLNPQDILFQVNFKDNYLTRKKKSVVELRQLRNAHYIIGRTDWDRRITSVMAPQSKYYIGQEMMRPVFFQKEWKPNANEKLTLFTTNGDSYFKGFETLCHTLSILQQYGYDVDWYVAGVSENSLINKIAKKYLKEQYPRTGLHLLGSIDAETLSSGMMKADIYLMVSHIENSPNNLCEAMCLGMPCITTLAGGSSSLLENGKEGVVIQEGDPWVMAGAILELYRNRELAIEYGKNARTRAIKRHNPDQIVTDLLATYESIINDFQQHNYNG